MLHRRLNILIYVSPGSVMNINELTDWAANDIMTREADEA